MQVICEKQLRICKLRSKKEIIMTFLFKKDAISMITSVVLLEDQKLSVVEYFYCICFLQITIP